MRHPTHVDQLVRFTGSWLGNAFADQRLDSWQNNLTGFGTSRDKTMASFYEASCDLTDNALEALYHGEDLSQRIVDTLPEEALRKGYCLNIGKPHDEDTETEILDALDVLGANEKFIEAMIWGRLYGGCAIVLGADDGRPAQLPLIPERVRSLEALEVIDRRYLAVNSFYQDGPKMGQPETFAFGNPGMIARPVYIIHETRLIMFGGARTSRLERMRRAHWDHSVLKRPFEVLRSFATGFKSVETLLTDGPQGVYKIKNLASLLGSNKKQALEDRITTVEMMRSAMRAVVVDSDNEEFTRQSFTFAGIPDVLDKLMLRLAASVPMPVTMLMGQSPAGMNATGESDFRWFYDRVETYQKNYVGPRLRRLIEVLCASKEGPTSGQVPDTMKIEFAALWTLAPKEEAERRLAVAQTDKIYNDMGWITPEEGALSRFGERGWEDGYKVDRELRETDQEAGDEDNSPPPTAFTPTENAALLSVDEGRAALGQGPDPDPEFGKLKVAAALAQLGAQGAVEGDAAGKVNTGQPVVEPVVMPGQNPNDPHADPSKAGATGQPPAKAQEPKPGAAVPKGNAPASGAGAVLPKGPSKSK